MTWEVKQTRRFGRAYKKLAPSVALAVDAAVASVGANPDVGVRKKGDLGHLWVHKFRCGRQLYLLGYTRIDAIRLISLEAVGTHENFYRDIKR